MNHPKSLHSRLIYPFYFNEKHYSEAISSLLELRQLHKDEHKAAHNIWEEISTVPEFYKQEFLQTGQRFLFPNGGYLRVTEGRANAWFRNKIKVTVPTSRDDFYIKLAKFGIELFISPFGVGLLSIGIEVILPDNSTIKSINSYKQYNYALSQFGIQKKVACLSIPLSLNNPNYDQLTSKLALNTDHISKKLGVDGSSFSLKQLSDYLVSTPLKEYGFNKIQQQFSIFSVISFDKNVDFSSKQTQKEMASFLSGMAQIEEPNHAGNPPNSKMNIPNQIMNTRHWAAMSFLGTAHLISDQGIDFDKQRRNTIYNKYFIPYLARFYQRLILQKLLDSASMTIYDKMCNEACTTQFCDINTQLLDFTVAGVFTEISSREAVNQYYRMGEKALSINKNIEQVTSAIHNYDANQIIKNLNSNIHNMSEMQKSVDKNISQMSQMHKSIDKNISQMNKIQGSVEWFQVLFVIGVTAQLTEYIGVMSGPGMFAQLSTFIAPIVTGILALAILRPWTNDPDFKQKKIKLWSLGGIIAFTFCIWWWSAFNIGKNKSITKTTPNIEKSKTALNSK